MGSIKRCICKILLPCFLYWITAILVIISAQKKYQYAYYIASAALISSVINAFCLLLYFCFIIGTKLIHSFIRRRKFILKKSISKPDDLFENIASVIPSEDEVVLIEEKASVYLKDIKGALSSRFNCSIRFMACGSIPERFGVPLVDDWISDVGKIHDAHALLSDNDFLEEPFGITASYSAQSYTVEIVQWESFIEEGYAMLNISRPVARRFNLKEGFLSTTAIKHSVLRCISKVPATKFPGIVTRDQNPWLDRLSRLSVSHLATIHGPAINLHIQTLDNDSIFLADFTFAIPCFKWPPESDWPFRNKMWPDHRVVAGIKDLGFHFVPVNQKKDKSKLTWRYSFSLAERELSKEVNEIARNCFLCLKIIHVDHLKPICKRLKSYHLKTILFRALEVTSAKTWSQKKILNCLDYLLKELQEAFHQQRCLHFWISRINLFQNFKHRRLSKLELKVKDIRKNLFPFLFTYSTKFRPPYRSFDKKQELFCFCFGLVRDDKNMLLQIKKGTIRKSISKDVTAEEGNCVQVSPEEAALNIDSHLAHCYGSFNQDKNQSVSGKTTFYRKIS